MTFINVTGGAQTHFSSLLFPNVLRYSTSPTKSQLNHWLFVSTPWCARLHAPTRRQCLQNLSFNCFRSPTPCTAWGVKLIVSKVPKKQTKGTKSADLWQWKGGGGGQKNKKSLRTSYMEAPKEDRDQSHRSDFRYPEWGSNNNQMPICFGISTLAPNRLRGWCVPCCARIEF